VAKKRNTIYLDEITEQTLRLQKRTLDRLEQWSDQLDESPEQFDADFAKELASVTRALATVLKEARAINKDNAAATAKLGPTEKRKLLVDWFEKQPYEVKRSLLWEMTQLCNASRVDGKSS
tara:strand:+ start:533 stop:895 length:363 start_codon:yes stop_codon:yes gene_type:complete